ncbi:MAG: glycoside hydrolase family 97 N-terminal domain-containing protein, partial [bacterium]
MKIKLFLSVFLVLLLQSADVFADVSIQSPGRTVEAVIGVDDAGRLGYALTRPGGAVVDRSPMGVTVDGADLGLGVSLGEPEWSYVDVTHPARGVHSVAVDRHTGAKIPVKHAGSGTEYFLEFRVYDDGAAYRYVIPGAGKRKVSGEASAWRLPAGCEIWYQTNLNNYEGEFHKVKAEKVDAGDRLGLPVTVELPGGGYAALTEGALFNYSGMSLKAMGDNTFAAEFVDDPGGWTLEGEISTPWLITIAVDDLNALVISDIIANVNEPPAPELADAD